MWRCDQAAIPVIDRRFEAATAGHTDPLGQIAKRSHAGGDVQRRKDKPQRGWTIGNSAATTTPLVRLQSIGSQRL